MKYEDFEKFVREQCLYETIYDDSDGRRILVIKLLDAYGMVNNAPMPTKLMGPNLEDVLNAAGFHKQREWQGLTDEEINAAVKSCNTTDTYKYFRAIEAKLKEKNND